ncbi:hypothetical protein C2G38_197498 [Gigaspora rosea]|uniref:Uncharacterized protein n=1 Tax=Gigaspora rosea TaxID=44941 RepID=A0A397UJ83_9GLOM|nr:hypothetical protein C2G38_197498 [Gigaspora rosea]
MNNYCAFRIVAALGIIFNIVASYLYIYVGIIISTEIGIICNLIQCIIEIIALLFIMIGNKTQVSFGTYVGLLIIVYSSSFISYHFDSEAICKKMLNGYETNTDLINCKYAILKVKLSADILLSLADSCLFYVLEKNA